MTKVKWGILSTAKIATDKVIPALQKCPDIEVAAIASRSPARAKKAAAALGIGRAHGSYEALIADPDIEVIYNPLPNHLHVPLTLAAARAGKHVLCEKPMAMTAAEARVLRKAPRGVLIAEAFMIRHAPQWLEVKRLLKARTIGEVKIVQVHFSYFNRNPRDVRNQAKIGGGGLLDIGCYAMTAARFVFGAEPERVAAMMERDPAFKTDRVLSALADFGKGRHLSFAISTQLAQSQRVAIIGSKGRIDVEVPFNAPADRPTRIFIQGMTLNEGEWRSFPPSDQYQLQGEAFSRAVRKEEKLAFGVDNAIANMAALDAVARAGKSGKWEKVKRV
jgi:predicted dehydrogenase